MRWQRISRHWNREFAATLARYFQSLNVVEIHAQYASLRHVVSSNPRSANAIRVAECGNRWNRPARVRNNMCLWITMYFYLRRWPRCTPIHEPNSVIPDSFFSPIHSARLIGFQQKPDSLWCSRRQINPRFLSLGCRTLRVIVIRFWRNQHAETAGGAATGMVPEHAEKYKKWPLIAMKWKTQRGPAHRCLPDSLRAANQFSTVLLHNTRF